MVLTGVYSRLVLSYWTHLDHKQTAVSLPDRFFHGCSRDSKISHRPDTADGKSHRAEREPVRGKNNEISLT